MITVQIAHEPSNSDAETLATIAIAFLGTNGRSTAHVLHALAAYHSGDAIGWVDSNRPERTFFGIASNQECDTAIEAQFGKDSK